MTVTYHRTGVEYGHVWADCDELPGWIVRGRDLHECRRAVREAIGWQHDGVDLREQWADGRPVFDVIWTSK